MRTRADSEIDPLVDAAHDGRLPEVAAQLVDDPAVPPPRRALARDAVAACEAIGEAVAALAAEVASITGEHAEVVCGPRQRRSITIPVVDHAAASDAAARLSRHGFERWQRWARGAERSFARHAGELTVARTGAVADVVRFRWTPPGRLGRLPGPVARMLRPTEADWAAVALPGPLSGLYPVVRLTRLAAERIGVRPRHRSSGLGPHLATPLELIAGLARFASVGPEDVVADLGCGDGRIVVELARSIGCRSIGIESDAALAAMARDTVVASELGDQVTIVHGDALDTDLSDVTVVVVFLPANVVADVLPELLGRLAPGARVVVHEQQRRARSQAPAPDATELVVSGAALTVAHRWTVG